MRRLNREEGATAVTVAVVLIVLFGFIAIVIDVGALFWERRQLQNGADAAALSIIEECLRSGLPCTGVAAEDMAEFYANANANDQLSDVEELDFDPVDCWVEVTTRTLTPDESFLLPSFFFQVVNPSYDGTTVRARAVARCGGIAGGSGLPLILGPNTWDQLEPKAPAPEECGPSPSIDDPCWASFEPPTETSEVATFFHESDDQEHGAGSFGWLALDDGEDCLATIDEAGQVDTNTGNNFSCDFHNAAPHNAAAFRDYVLDNNPHIIPIFSSQAGTGNNLTYTAEGFAVVWITGWRFSGQHYVYPPDDPPCSGNERCISGVFFENVVFGDGLGVGDVNLGAMTYALIE